MNLKVLFFFVINFQYRMAEINNVWFTAFFANLLLSFLGLKLKTNNNIS
jgi:hypothetical protein